ncbi:hypothetical protein RFI_22728 [Reticulomyxa filosa]|uniref:Homeobox domain-containing protein n=1 Tax=Reticulomyxa filosa TaxID=46433 RepID=X6MLV6_RETFI|nr:hypothetical protein RFI_22728 [Reticulomyxa filosa]|eukprot:ETO14641.1 hypothetical protein RFI_22728 [Reticulomyxa filosa]
MQQYLTQMEIDAKIQERKYFNNFFQVGLGKGYSSEDVPNCDVSDHTDPNNGTNSDTLDRTPESLDGSGSCVAKKKSAKRKKRTKKPKFSEYDVRVFADWYNMHLDNPYPSKQEKQLMAELTGLTRYQVSRWFCNARTRRPPAMPCGQNQS